MATVDVLLADCFTRSGLAIARSLSRAGLKVGTVARSTANIVFKSRFAGIRRIAPSPEKQITDYADCIGNIASETRARLVIPVTDAAVFALNSHRNSFGPETVLALPNETAVERVLNKPRNLAMARQLGVPCPRQFSLTSAGQVTEMVATLGFPIAVKNPAPKDADKLKPLPFRFTTVQNNAELKSLLDSIRDCDVIPIFQEFVSGQAQNICLFADDGDCLAIHQYISRRKSTHEGICREIVPLRDDLEDYTRRMIAELRWSGVAHVGFITDYDSQKSWYMETNGRFWASTQGSINAGWDFPVWVYRYFVDGIRPDIGPIEVGCRTVYRKGDLEQLLVYLAGGQSPTFYTDPGRMRAIKEYLADFRPSVYPDVWSWRDPGPALYDYWRFFAGQIRRVLTRNSLSDNIFRKAGKNPPE